MSAVCLHFGTFCKQNVRKMFTNVFLHQQAKSPDAPIGQSAMIYKIKMSVRLNFAKPKHFIYKTCAFIT